VVQYDVLGSCGPGYSGVLSGVADRLWYAKQCLVTVRLIGSDELSYGRCVRTGKLWQMGHV
jgi:hypothetical protein